MELIVLVVNFKGVAEGAKGDRDLKRCVKEVFKGDQYLITAHGVYSFDEPVY